MITPLILLPFKMTMLLSPIHFPDRETTIAILIISALLGFVSIYTHRRDEKNAQDLEPHINPLNGTRDCVPNKSRARQWLAYSGVAALEALKASLGGHWTMASFLLLPVAAGVYAAWVYYRGAGPVFMEGFREFSDPPTPTLFRAREP